MEQGLTKGDWVRAAAAAAITVVAVPLGIASTAGTGQGSAFVTAPWIVMTPLVVGCVWVGTGRWAWADHRDMAIRGL